jgi:hypothetical protein
MGVSASLRQLCLAFAAAGLPFIRPRLDSHIFLSALCSRQRRLLLMLMLLVIIFF